MKRTTIYIEEDILDGLEGLAKRRSKINGHRVTVASLIREAVREFASQNGARSRSEEQRIARAMATFGKAPARFLKAYEEIDRHVRKWKM